VKKTLFRVKEALTHAASRDERDPFRCKLLVKSDELFRYSRLFITHLPSMQKTLEKCGFPACATHVRANANRCDRSHARRWIDIRKSCRDAPRIDAKNNLGYRC
jgi:uncharacterized protein with von Willebrand factor type A (vWA) domain